MIFVNLPITDVAASRAFYTGLGFSVNEMFSDEDTVAIVVSDAIVLMLLQRSRFADFVTGEVGDPKAATSVINCLTADSPQQVDELVGKALASGGSTWLAKMVDGPMYGHSFTDPDGNVWEVLHIDMAELPEGADR